MAAGKAGRAFATSFKADGRQDIHMGPQTYMESKRIVAAQMCIALDHQGFFMALLEQHAFAKDGKILEEMAPYIINSDEVGISLIGKQSKVQVACATGSKRTGGVDKAVRGNHR